VRKGKKSKEEQIKKSNNRTTKQRKTKWQNDKMTKIKQKQKVRMRNNRMINASRRGHQRTELWLRIQVIRWHSANGLSRSQDGQRSVLRMLLALKCASHMYSMTQFTPVCRLSITWFQEDIPQTSSKCQIHSTFSRENAISDLFPFWLREIGR
jgi:hypothetical protein